MLPRPKPAAPNVRHGYTRVSTRGQSADSQIARLMAAGCDQVFVDVGYSSRLEERPDWINALAATNRPGDELVIPALDRVAGTETIAINIIQSFAARSVRLLSLDEPWLDVDTSTAMGEAMLKILATLAELRVNIIRENTRRGIEFARSQGRFGGRPTVMGPERIEAARKMREDDLSYAQIGRVLGVGASSVRRALI